MSDERYKDQMHTNYIKNERIIKILLKQNAKPIRPKHNFTQIIYNKYKRKKHFISKFDYVN